MSTSDGPRRLPEDPKKKASKAHHKDLWRIASKTKDKERSSGDSRTLLVLGDQNAGKSSLILRFLDRTNEAVKPTTALEYTFGRRSRGHDNTKDVVHIWELGGGTALKELLETPITVSSIKSLSIVLVLDLSQPDTLWSTLDTLLSAASTRINKVLKDLETKESKIPAYLKKKTWSKYGNDHPDKDFLQPVSVPVLIVGNKYDIYQDMEPAKRKVLTRCLRFLAHMYGASLLMTGQKDEAMLNRCRAMMANFAFKIPYTSRTTCYDPDKPLIITAGSDSLGNIGAPPLAPDAEAVAARTPQALWHAAYATICPNAKKSQARAIPDDPCADAKYKEASIDAARARKDEELQRYRRQAERRARDSSKRS